MNFNKLTERLDKGASSVVRFCIYAILVFSILSAPVCMIMHFWKHGNFFSPLELVWIVPGLLLLWGIGKAAELLNKKGEVFIVLSMIAVECIIAAVMIFSYNTKPCSDYSVIWKAANEMAQGTFTDGTNPQAYMYYYNWQLGIAAFESLIIRAGGSFFTLKLLNALLLIIIQLGEYCLVKRKFGQKTAIYAYALATLWMPWCLSIPQFTNHHIGLVLLLLSFFLIDKEKLWTWCVSGAVLAVVNVLRPLGIIVVLSAICLAAYKIIKSKKAKPLALLAGFLACYFVVIAGFNVLFINLNYTDSNISDARVPYFKFQKGLYGYQYPGEDLTSRGYDYDKYNQAMKEELIDNVSGDPAGTVVFVANKMVRYLGLWDYQFEMTYNHDVDFYTQYPVKALYSTSWFQYLGVVVLAIIGYGAYRKKESVDIYQVFFIGNTLVYLFIEAYSSYRFESYPILIMFAALGYCRVSDGEFSVRHIFKRGK